LEERQDEARRELTETKRKSRERATERMRNDAFEIYYRMGQGRSYSRVAAEIHRSLVVVNNWGSKYEWPQRVKEREEEIRRRVAEHVVSEEVETRIRVGSKVERFLTNFFNYFDKLAEDHKRIDIITNIDDFERVVRLLLLLKGDRLEPLNGSSNGGMMMEETTVKRLVQDPIARESLETLWRRLPVVQGQIEVGEAGG
jgi:hypothetical protein